MTKLIDIDYVDGLSTDLTNLDNRITALEGGGGGSGGSSLTFATISDAETAEFLTVPDYIRVMGYYTAGDGGDAFYKEPTSVIPIIDDYITIDVGGTPYYLIRHHENNQLNLLAHGLLGDGSDETLAFQAAIEVANSRNLKTTIDNVVFVRLINKDPSKTFKVIMEAHAVELSRSIELDLGSGSLISDYNVSYTNTNSNIIRTITTGTSLILRNAVIDGTSPSSISGFGGHPLILMNGADYIEFDNVTVTRSANRDPSTFDSYMDYLDGGVQFNNPRVVRIHDSRFNANSGEQLVIQSDISNTYNLPLIEIWDCSFSKLRQDGSGNLWSSSHIVVYNSGKGSFVRGCKFGESVKTAVNWFGPATIEHCRFEGVRDSQALDLDEAGNFGIDQVVVRSCLFQNVVGGYAIRSSIRGLIVEDCSINRCQNGILIEHAPDTNPIFAGVGYQGSRDLYNIYIKNLSSNGNDVTDGTGASVTNTLIKVSGESSTYPIYVTVEGTQPHNAGNYPSANPEYGIEVSNCDLTLSGAFMHGRSALVRTSGWSNIKCKDARFSPQPGATTHVIQCTGTVENIVLEDTRCTTALDSGFYHITTSGATVTGKIFKTRSQTFSAISSSATVVTVD